MTSPSLRTRTTEHGRRLAARLHPILVRDVRRAFRTKTYGATMTLSCVAVVAIALLAVDREVAGLEIAGWTLRATLTALLPVLLFAVPLQAHLSLRDEVAGHTADQLLLAGMRPAGILFGMLGTALLQCALFLGFFAPLLGFSYLLLGVDLRTLFLVLLLAPLACCTTVTFGFASLRLRRWLGEHATTLVVIGLGSLTAFAVQQVDTLATDLARVARSPDYWLVVQSWLTLGLLVSLFCILLAAAALTPLRESRSVGFRMLGLAAMPTVTLLAGGGLDGAMTAGVLALPIALRAVTEPLTLNNRQRALVPPTKKERRRLAPFLPGSGRGLMYVVLLAVTCLIAGIFTEFTFRASTPDPDRAFRLVAVCGLLVAYSAYGLHYRLTGVEQSLLATGQARLGILARVIGLWVAMSLFDGMSLAAGKIGVAMLSSFNPLVVASGTRALLPAPLLAFAAVLFACFGVWLKRNALRFSLEELEAPGKLDVPPGLILEPRRRRGSGGMRGGRWARKEARRIQGRSAATPPALPIDRARPEPGTPSTDET